MDSETPEADAVEQARQAEEVPEEQEPPAEVPFDANPADMVDQHLAVPEDDFYERG